MDTSPPILAYASAAVAVKQEGRVMVFHPPPLGWEIALLTVGVLFCVGGIFVGILLTVDAIFRSYPELIRAIGDVMFLAAMAIVAVALLRMIALRRRFGHLPFSIEPEGDELLLYFPPRWGAAQRRLRKADVGPFTIHRRGWAANLKPQYELRVRWNGRVRLRVPFVGDGDHDRETLEPLLAAMLQ